MAAHSAQAQAQAQAIVAKLQGGLPAQQQLEAIRAMKNMVIGNLNRKTLFVRLGVVPLLLAIVRDGQEEVLQLQALVALGSLALGTPEDVNALVANGAVPVLVGAILSQKPRLVEAGARSLKFLMQTQAQQVGAVVTAEMLAQLVERLDADVYGVTVAELVATVVARCCVTTSLQGVLVNSGGLQRLLTLLASQQDKVRDAALDAIASLTKDNVAITQQLVDLDYGSRGGQQQQQQRSPVAMILTLVKDLNPHTRLLASQCATNLTKCIKDIAFVQEVKSLVLPTLLKLLDAPGSVQELTPIVLAALVTDNEVFQVAASDTDAISKLAMFVQAPEEAVSPKLREASLLAMAAICLQKEECRKQVVDAKVLPHVILALSHVDPGVRTAACQLSRSLSRSVKALRTALVDAGIATSLFRLLSDPNVVVQRVACATICNIVLDFSPMKQLIIENQGIKKLVALVKVNDTQLRLNALWALKNMMFETDVPTKDLIMGELTYPTLLTLLGDAELTVQEQALNLLRNLSANKGLVQAEVLDKLFQGCGNALGPIIEQQLKSPFAEIVTQTLYVCVNIATGNSKHKLLLMNNAGIISRVLALLSHELAVVRLAAVWCVINLTFVEDVGAPFRISALRGLGFKAQLLRMGVDNDQDVRDRVKMALGNFALDESERVALPPSS